MDAHLLNKYNRVKEMAEHCDIRCTHDSNFIVFTDKKGLNLGGFETVQEAFCFICGYDWGLVKGKDFRKKFLTSKTKVL